MLKSLLVLLVTEASLLLNRANTLSDGTASFDFRFALNSNNGVITFTAEGLVGTIVQE